MMPSCACPPAAPAVLPQPGCREGGPLNTVILHISSSALHQPICLGAPATRAADNSGFVSHYFTGHLPLMGSGTGSEAPFLSTVKARLSSCLALLSCALIVSDILTVPVLPAVCVAVLSSDRGRLLPEDWMRLQTARLSIEG